MQTCPLFIVKESELSIMMWKAASKTLLVLREGVELLTRPFYWSVTWLLKQILGSFELYIGIEHVEQPPDCDVFEDWTSVMVILLMMFFILAMIFFFVESRLTPKPVRHPFEAWKFPKDEDGSPKDGILQSRSSLKIEDVHMRK